MIDRLNSGITNMDNFFEKSIFNKPKIGNESVAHSDSGDIKIFVEFPGNSNLEFLFEF